MEFHRNDEPDFAGGAPIIVRSFDVNANTFTLNYAKVGIGVNPDPVGLRLDLGYGATGSIINAAYPPDVPGNTAQSLGSWFSRRTRPSRRSPT